MIRGAASEYKVSNSYPSASARCGISGLNVCGDGGLTRRLELQFDERVGTLQGIESSIRTGERLAVVVRDGGLDTVTSVIVGCNVAIVSDGVIVESETSTTASTRGRTGGAPGCAYLFIARVAG